MPCSGSPMVSCGRRSAYPHCCPLLAWEAWGTWPFALTACPQSPFLPVSHLSHQIYNEMIRDLLNPALGYLELREDAKGVIQVAGITEVSTINAKEASLMRPAGATEGDADP